MKASRTAALLSLTDAHVRRKRQALLAARGEVQQLKSQRVAVTEHLKRYQNAANADASTALPGALHLQHKFRLGLTRHVRQIDALIDAAEERLGQVATSCRRAQARHLALQAVHRRTVVADTLASERQERRRDDEWVRSLSARRRPASPSIPSRHASGHASGRHTDNVQRVDR